ncbi:DUF6090 family protein [Hyphomonas sp.]|uniref:DUF6090 family protein n=1 Tax=Hyphomonas sp. TaxID=87 RepID=UPI0030F79BA1
MILRRLSNAFRKQDWFTVVVETLIVVLGVFIGLQVNNWNEARTEQARVVSYLDRLASDLRSDVTMYERNFAFKTRAVAEGRLALAYTQQPNRDAPPFEIVRSFMLASHALTLPVADATYSEMISTGDIRLLRDPELQQGLASYYSNVDLNDIVEEFPEYRQTVRGIIPLDVQDYINAACYRSDRLRQEFLPCKASVDLLDLEQTADLLRSDEALARELRYWLSNGGLALTILGDQRRGSIELLRVVEITAQAAR